MLVAISSGHGKYISGAVGPAPWGLHEHNEAVRVVNRTAEKLRAAGVDVRTFEDTTSHDVNTNLATITNWHNSIGPHDLDLSIHFNSNGNTEKPLGCEVFYWHTSSDGKDWARKIVNSICAAVPLINRGPKPTDSLYVLHHTREVCCLVECLFVNSHGDVNIYNAQFDDFCGGLADAITGELVPVPEPEPGVWIENITATVFGGSSDPNNSAYPPYGPLNDSDRYLALPYKFPGERPQVEVRNSAGAVGTGSISDVGPWMIDDDYFRQGTRPVAETCYKNHTPLPSGPNAGRVPSNDAGIDLSPALARDLGIDGKGKVSFRLLDGTQPAPEPEPEAATVDITTTGAVRITVNGQVINAAS